MSLPVFQLGELCDIDRKGIAANDSDSHSLPFVGLEDVESDSSTLNFENGSRAGSQKSATFRFDERHVLYAKLRPYLNKVATPGFSGRCSTELVPLLPRSGVDRRFIAHFLRRKEVVKFAMTSVTGSRMPRTDMKALMSLLVPLPPLDEQRRIVGILNQAAKIERLRAQVQERLRELIPALFVKIFGDPATNSKGWPVSRLGDACTIVGGGTPHRSNDTYFSGSILWATPTDVSGLDGLWIHQTAEMITEDGLCDSSARLVPAGTVLLTSRASIGFTAIASTEMATNQGFANLICGKCLLPEYLAIWLHLKRDRLIQLAGGTTFREISKSTLKGMEVPLPELALQRKFADLINAAYRVIATAKAGSASALTASLMSRLLEKAA